MRSSTYTSLIGSFFSALVFLSTDAAVAASGSNEVPPEELPINDGGYLYLSGSARFGDDEPFEGQELDTSYGAQLLYGIRGPYVGWETGFGYQAGSDDVTQMSMMLHALIYPFKSGTPVWGNLHLLVGGGASRYDDYPFERSESAFQPGTEFYTAEAKAGVGYTMPFRFGRYEYGLRFEGVYRYGDRFIERENDFEPDISAPGSFNDVFINIGVYFPTLPGPGPRIPEPKKADPRVVEPVAPEEGEGAAGVKGGQESSGSAEREADSGSVDESKGGGDNARGGSAAESGSDEDEDPSADDEGSGLDFLDS